MSGRGTGYRRRVVTDGRPSSGMLEERAQLLVGSLSTRTHSPSGRRDSQGSAEQYLKEAASPMHGPESAAAVWRTARTSLAAYSAAGTRAGSASGSSCEGAEVCTTRARRDDNLGGSVFDGHRTGFGDGLAPARAVKHLAGRITWSARTPPVSTNSRERPLRGERLRPRLPCRPKRDACGPRSSPATVRRQVARHAIGDRASTGPRKPTRGPKTIYPRPKTTRHRIRATRVVQPRQGQGPGRGARRDRLPKGPASATELGDGMLARSALDRHAWMYGQRSLWRRA